MRTMPISSTDTRKPLLLDPARCLPSFDPRLYQVLFLGTFLVFGILALGWYANVWQYAAILSTAIVVQGTLMIVTQGVSKFRWRSLLSGLITSLGICLLLKANSTLTLMLAVTFALLSKFTLRYQKKHFFNPANFGIIAAIFLTGDAWVSPGQWGHDALMVFLFAATGMLITRKVGRLDTTVAFLVTFAGLLYIRSVLSLGWETDVWLHKLSNGSLLLFAFFMVTDPRSIPDHRLGRIIWAVLIGVGAFVVSIPGLVAESAYVHTAVIWTLFFAAPLTPLIDRLLPAKRFEWQSAPAAESEQEKTVT